MFNKIEEAIHFLYKANKGQRLKYENIDRTFHSVVVGMMIKEFTKTEDVIVAAFLHDIINKTNYGYEDLERLFGPVVADYVFELSEDMSIAKWFLRKKDFIERMKKVTNVHIINIVLADKLHTLMMLYDPYQRVGDKIWKMTDGTKDENCYLYRETYSIAFHKGANSKLLERYKELIVLYFGEIHDETI